VPTRNSTDHFHRANIPEEKARQKHVRLSYCSQVQPLYSWELAEQRKLPVIEEVKQDTCTTTTAYIRGDGDENSR